MTEMVIHGLAVEIHFSGIFRFEGATLEIADDETAKLKVVEKKIYEKLLVAHLETILTSYKGEPALLLVAFGHSTQQQTLDYLCIQAKEIEEIYGLEL